MGRFLGVTALLLLVTAALPAPVGGQDEAIAMSRVRLTTEPELTQGCTRVGSARDDSVKDLRRKIVKMGGNAAHISFGGTSDLSTVYAEVFRCADAPPTAPGTAPARVPVAPAPPPR
jgi:hypothetical protein